MNKSILATIIFASLSAAMMPAHAIEIDPVAQSIIDTAVKNECNVDIVDTQDLGIVDTPECDLSGALVTAIANNPTLVESLVAAAIAAVGADTEAAELIIASAIETLGPDSPLIASILQIATEAGVNADTVTVIAIASGVDATIASNATAAGSNAVNAGNANAGNSRANTAGGGGGGIIDAGAGTGGGGGGGGVSTNL